jgi:hypothetical protein
MNNEIKFTALAHNLLLKQGVETEERQVHKNKAANRQTSPQAAWKKRFMPLDLGRFQTRNAVIHNTTRSQKFEWKRNEDSSKGSLLPHGSIGIQAALDQPPHE